MVLCLALNPTVFDILKKNNTVREFLLLPEMGDVELHLRHVVELYASTSAMPLALRAAYSEHARKRSALA